MSMIARMREKSEVGFVDGVAITDADLQRMDDGAAQVHAMSSRAFDQNAEATRDAGHKSGGVCFVEHNASTETTLSTTADAPSVLVVHDGETVRLEPRHYHKVVLLGSGVAVMVPGTTIHTAEFHGTGGIAQDPPPFPPPFQTETRKRPGAFGVLAHTVVIQSGNVDCVDVIR